MRTIIVLPTYNEANNLRPIVTALLALPELELAVLVVDDDSPDGTGAIADELIEEFPDRVHVLHRKEKAGLGAAYRAGFRSAMEMGAQYIGQMDADFSHSPDYLPEMTRSLADYDIVVGSRYVKGGSTDERWEWGRYMLSWFANRVYTRAILRLAVKDATAGLNYGGGKRYSLLGCIAFVRMVISFKLKWPTWSKDWAFVRLKSPSILKTVASGVRK